MHHSVRGLDYNINHIRNVATYSFIFSFSYCNLTEFKILSLYNLDSTIISNLGYFCIGSGLAYQIYLAFRCTKASTSLITLHINNTHAQILKCITHAISFKGNHYNPTLVTFKILGRHSPYKIFSKNFIHLIYIQKVCQSKYIFKLFCGPDRT